MSQYKHGKITIDFINFVPYYKTKNGKLISRVGSSRVDQISDLDVIACYLLFLEKHYLLYIANDDTFTWVVLWSCLATCKTGIYKGLPQWATEQSHSY